MYKLALHVADSEEKRAGEAARRADSERAMVEIVERQRIRDMATLIRELAFSRAVLCDRFVLERGAFAYLDLPDVKERTASRAASEGVRVIKERAHL
jgi:hypothetical protein